MKAQLQRCKRRGHRRRAGRCTAAGGSSACGRPTGAHSRCRRGGRCGLRRHFGILLGGRHCRDEALERGRVANSLRTSCRCSTGGGGGGGGGGFGRLDRACLGLGVVLKELIIHAVVHVIIVIALFLAATAAIAVLVFLARSLALCRACRLELRLGSRNVRLHFGRRGLGRPSQQSPRALCRALCVATVQAEAAARAKWRRAVRASKRR